MIRSDEGSDSQFRNRFRSIHAVHKTSGNKTDIDIRQRKTRILVNGDKFFATLSLNFMKIVIAGQV
eukprot:SAG31_NODE_431_length_15775_cov_3.350663_9_plen_66_part_00